jgi:hypothetical protein
VGGTASQKFRKRGGIEGPDSHENKEANLNVISYLRFWQYMNNFVQSFFFFMLTNSEIGVIKLFSLKS